MSLRVRVREREGKRERERERKRERANNNGQQQLEQVRSHVASKLAEHGPAEHGRAEQGRPRPNMAPTADTANSELPRGPDDRAAMPPSQGRRALGAQLLTDELPHVKTRGALP